MTYIEKININKIQCFFSIFKKYIFSRNDLSKKKNYKREVCDGVRLSFLILYQTINKNRPLNFNLNVFFRSISFVSRVFKDFRMIFWLLLKAGKSLPCGRLWIILFIRIAENTSYCYTLNIKCR